MMAAGLRATAKEANTHRSLQSARQSSIQLQRTNYGGSHYQLHEKS